MYDDALGDPLMVLGAILVLGILGEMLLETAQSIWRAVKRRIEDE